MSDFILRTAEKIGTIQSTVDILFSFLIGGFLGILIYGIIKFIYDICKSGLKKAIKNFGKFIWVPLIGSLIGTLSWSIVAIFFYFLSQVIPFDNTITQETNLTLYSYVSMAALYNIIFLLIGSILIEFSFKNKIIYWTGIIICIIGLIFPLTASILCMP